MKGIGGQSRPKNPRMNALTHLPSTETNKNAKGDPLRCYISNQMDQHVLDIQRNILFPQIVHPDRGIPWHKTARRLPQIPGCGESLPTDFLSLPPGVPGSGLSARIFSAVKSSSSPSSSESTSPAVNSKVTGRPLGSGAWGRSWVWWRSRILLSPTRTAYTSCPTFRTITPRTYQDACRCLDRTSLWCRSTHTVSWRAYFRTYPCLKYLALLSCLS